MNKIVTLIAVALISITSHAIEVPLPEPVTFAGIDITALQVRNQAAFDLAASEWEVKAEPIGTAPELNQVDGARVDFGVAIQLVLRATRGEIEAFLGIDDVREATVGDYYDAIWAILLTKATAALQEKPE